MTKLAIVCSEFNYDLTYMMLERAKEHAKFLGVEIEEIKKVAGTYDMPLAIKKMVQKQNIDAIVALGCVIQGETKHDEVVMQHASRKITDLSLEYEKPIALGIIGPGVTRVQATKRIDSYAKRAVESAIKSLNAIK